MPLLVALLYLVAVAALVFGWIQTLRGKDTAGSGYLAAACALLGFALASINAGLHGH